VLGPHSCSDDETARDASITKWLNAGAAGPRRDGESLEDLQELETVVCM